MSNLDDVIRDGVLTVVPARGGSKGIPRKNLQELDGKPLVAHQILTAINATTAGTPIVSTDDDEIAAVAQEYGAIVPFKRPCELSIDDIPVIAAVKHCAEYIAERIDTPTHVVCLQPTSPFTRPTTLDAAIAKAVETGCDGVATIAKVTETHPYRTYRFEGDRIQPLEGITVEAPHQRQDRPDVYGFTGAVYVRTDDVLTAWDYDDFALGDDTRGVVQSPEEAFDIDTPFELKLARALCAYGE